MILICVVVIQDQSCLKEFFVLVINIPLKSDLFLSLCFAA